MELYRQHKDVMLPLLARLYSGIGATNSLPAGFSNGAITTIHKANSRSDPANYRPITLLNTDYRLLAKVLSNRLAAKLPDIISPEQTAFLQGRSIGENHHVLQLLPHQLRREERWALVVLCDFAKAFDTVDRSFLLRVLHKLGLGTGFALWVDLLLTDTRSAAIVNGCLSNLVTFEAGLRQGCPLSSLLYLCVAQALLCLLRHRDVGVSIAGLPRRLPALQFADDLKALLEGGATRQEAQTRVGDFLDTMATFTAASGQRLNTTKTKILPIGDLPPWP